MKLLLLIAIILFVKYIFNNNNQKQIDLKWNKFVKEADYKYKQSELKSFKKRGH